MYKGPLTDGPLVSAVPRAAAAAAVTAVLPAAAPQLAAATALGVYTDDTPKARNEAWSRLHGDPMLLVRTVCPSNEAPLTQRTDQAAGAELAEDYPRKPREDGRHHARGGSAEG